MLFRSNSPDFVVPCIDRPEGFIIHNIKIFQLKMLVTFKNINNHLPQRVDTDVTAPAFGFLQRFVNERCNFPFFGIEQTVARTHGQAIESFEDVHSKIGRASCRERV